MLAAANRKRAARSARPPQKKKAHRGANSTANAFVFENPCASPLPLTFRDA